MLTRSILTTLALALLLVVAVAPKAALAAIDAYLYIDGVRGSSTDRGHENEIPVLSWSMGVTHAGTGARGTGERTGKTSLHEITITKVSDASSAALMQAAATGRHFPKATLFVRKAGGGGSTYMTYTMSDVMVTSIHRGATGGGLANESVTFAYGALKIEYQSQKPETSASKLAPAPAAVAKLSPAHPAASTPTGAAAPAPIRTQALRQPGGGCMVAGSSPPVLAGHGWSYQLTSPAPTANGAPILIRLTGLTANDHVLVSFLPATGETITPLHVTVGGASAMSPLAIAHLTEHGATPGLAAPPCWQAQLSLSRSLP